MFLVWFNHITLLHGVHHTYSAVLNKQGDIRRNATENSNMVSHGDNVGCVLEHAIFICAQIVWDSMVNWSVMPWVDISFDVPLRFPGYDLYWSPLLLLLNQALVWLVLAGGRWPMFTCHKLLWIAAPSLMNLFTISRRDFILTTTYTSVS